MIGKIMKACDDDIDEDEDGTYYYKLISNIVYLFINVIELLIIVKCIDNRTFLFDKPSTSSLFNLFIVFIQRTKSEWESRGIGCNKKACIDIK